MCPCTPLSLVMCRPTTSLRKATRSSRLHVCYEREGELCPMVLPCIFAAKLGVELSYEALVRLRECRSLGSVL